MLSVDAAVRLLIWAA